MLAQRALIPAPLIIVVSFYRFVSVVLPGAGGDLFKSSLMQLL
jgi:hypothetical protein